VGTSFSTPGQGEHNTKAGRASSQPRRRSPWRVTEDEDLAGVGMGPWAMDLGLGVGGAPDDRIDKGAGVKDLQVL
jgi:hypothetical protein